MNSLPMEIKRGICRHVEKEFHEGSDNPWVQASQIMYSLGIIERYNIVTYIESIEHPNTPINIVFDKVECIIKYLKMADEDAAAKLFSMIINHMLSENNVGYRLITNGKFIKITNDEELASIEQALEALHGQAYDNLDRSLILFTEGDYTNALNGISSSIEALLNDINGTSNKTLSASLDTLKENSNAPEKALLEGWKKMYGFFSQTTRHGGNIDENDAAIGNELAKYFLVSGSAFINYLISKHEK